VDNSSKVNEIDQKYEKLECDLTPLDPKSEKFEFLSNYFNESHGQTHMPQKCLEIFEVERKGEAEKFTSKIGNERLQWHGSGYYNYGGILSQGLRIAPPEAPVSGYMFGKGAYFADVASKSAQYCRASCSEGIGLMLLCNVAVGKPNELMKFNYDAANLPKGCSSTHGVGRMRPDPAGDINYEGDSTLAAGKIVNDANHPGSLYYNEFIVYDVAQVQMKYLFKVKIGN
jgi:hypothetical protein